MKKFYVLCVLIPIILFAGCIIQKDTSMDNKQCGDCPQFAPPPPDWCKDGTIVPGIKDECGCQMPPNCEKKQ